MQVETEGGPYCYQQDVKDVHGYRPEQYGPEQER